MRPVTPSQSKLSGFRTYYFAGDYQKNRPSYLYSKPFYMRKPGADISAMFSVNFSKLYSTNRTFVLNIEVRNKKHRICTNLSSQEEC